MQIQAALTAQLAANAGQSTQKAQSAPQGTSFAEDMLSASRKLSSTGTSAANQAQSAKPDKADSPPRAKDDPPRAQQPDKAHKPDKAEKPDPNQEAAAQEEAQPVEDAPSQPALDEAQALAAAMLLTMNVAQQPAQEAQPELIQMAQPPLEAAAAQQPLLTQMPDPAAQELLTQAPPQPQGITEQQADMIQSISTFAPALEQAAAAIVPAAEPVKAPQQPTIGAQQDAQPIPMTDAQEAQPAAERNTMFPPVQETDASNDAERTVAKKPAPLSETQTQEQPHTEALGASDQHIAATAGQDAAATNTELTFPDSTAGEQVKQAFTQQLSQQVEQAVTKQTNEIFIKLKPDVLGGIAIHLTMTEEGVKAQFKTSSQNVQNLMNDQIAQLQAELKDKGVAVVQMDVVYQQMASGEQLGQGRRGSQFTGSGQSSQRGSYGMEAVTALQESAYENLYQTMLPLAEEDAPQSMEFSA